MSFALGLALSYIHNGWMRETGIEPRKETFFAIKDIRNIGLSGTGILEDS